jgi:hypothetical protein
MGFFDALKSIFGGAPLGADYWNKLLRLPAEETIVFTASGRLVASMSGREVTLGAGYILVITSMGRLVLGDMQTMNPALARHFSPGTVRVQDHGYLDEKGTYTGVREYQQAGPTGVMERVKILAFTPDQGAPFTVIAAESTVPQLLSWCHGM